MNCDIYSENILSFGGKALEIIRLACLPNGRTRFFFIAELFFYIIGSTSARLGLAVIVEIGPQNLGSRISSIIYSKSGNQVAAFETFSL